MGSAGIVEVVDISAQRSPCLRHAGVGPKIDLLVFDCPPEPFDEHVVAPCALAVHGDGDLVLLQQIGESHAGELASLDALLFVKRLSAATRTAIAPMIGPSTRGSRIRNILRVQVRSAFSSG